MRHLTEVGVFNAVRSYLKARGALVLQLVPPGGQAPISLTYKVNGKRKTCFPDMLAIDEGCLLVGEFKPGYSEVDRAKLLEILSCGQEQLLALVRRLAPEPQIPITSIAGLLCHSQVPGREIQDLCQWVFDHSGELILRTEYLSRKFD